MLVSGQWGLAWFGIGKREKVVWVRAFSGALASGSSLSCFLSIVHCRRFPLFVATPRPAQARSVAQYGVHCTCPHHGLGRGRDIETYINMVRWMYSTKYRINTLHFSSVPYCISRREDGNSPKCGEKCKSHVYKNNNSPKGMRKSSKKQRNPVRFGDSQE